MWDEGRDVLVSTYVTCLVPASDFFFLAACGPRPTILQQCIKPKSWAKLLLNMHRFLFDKSPALIKRKSVIPFLISFIVCDLECMPVGCINVFTWGADY